jgi:hypothetical protein
VPRGQPKLSWSLERLARVTRSLENGQDVAWDGMMEDEFPGCCAFGIVFDLDTMPNAVSGWPTKAFDAFFISRLAKHAGPTGFTILTTSERQAKIEASLRRIGAEALKTVANSNSGNRVTLWLATTPR